ncbi:MAG TPA: NUDIX hydrolase [Streptosporangiaceae bacterium]|nr:NUDIX hydrolase [Streptosporangiaceae bacterium]
MVDRDGNGWTTCDLGHRHWGRFGAAGLLAYAPGSAEQADMAGRRGRAHGAGQGDRGGQSGQGDRGATTYVLLQRRSWWGNHGGTWGPPGGARDSHESAATAAFREAEEECAMPAGAVSARGILLDDHGGWSYQTVVAAAPRQFPVRAVSSETSKASWVAAEDVAALDLHPGFAAWWPVLREALLPLTIIVDAANVMGSRPDGWWRDRAGAARRLRDQLVELAAEGVAALPETMQVPALELWYPEIVLVVEGAARSVAAVHAAGPRRGDGSGLPGGEHGRGAGRAPGSAGGRGPGSAGGRGPGSAGGRGPGSAGGRGPGSASGGELGSAGGRVRVIAAPGSGDDTIAEVAADLEGRRLVVTADRELRARCEAAGASVTGPRWLLAQL